MTNQSWSDTRYEAVARLLSARTGLSFRPIQRSNTEQGIRRAMERAEVSDPGRYLNLLAHDLDLLDDLIVELTVGETYFFREIEQFEFLRTEALPELLRTRPPGHALRIWSAACASGEEAYSLAILCHQMGLARQAQILATDISSEALNKARHAIYRAWSLRGAGAERARPYLKPVGELFQLDERIRRSVRFEFLNLAVDIYPSIATGTRDTDVIFCRNVLIYFDPDTVAAVARRLFDSLAEGGWLITGAGDPPLDNLIAGEVVIRNAGVFYRKGPRPIEAAWLPLFPSEALPAVTPPPPVLTADREEKSAARTTDRGTSPALPPQETAPVSKPVNPVDQARAALERGDYRRAAELTRANLSSPNARVVLVKALANLDLPDAVAQCGEAVEQFPLSTELHYLHAIVLLDAGRYNDAARAARRVVYLDRSLALAHFTLGSLARRLGLWDAARRSFRNTRDLCAMRPADEPLPLADGETAGQLAVAAAAQLASLDAALEVRR